MRSVFLRPKTFYAILYPYLLSGRVSSMKLLWKLSREAVRYKNLYIVAILSTLGLTVVNLAAPKVL